MRNSGSETESVPTKSSQSPLRIRSVQVETARKSSKLSDTTPRFFTQDDALLGTSMSPGHKSAEECNKACKLPHWHMTMVVLTLPCIGTTSPSISLTAATTGLFSWSTASRSPALLPGYHQAYICSCLCTWRSQPAVEYVHLLPRFHEV